MLKSTYDTDNDGIVDNAEKVNNHTVESDVPSNAVFTDTTYTAGTGISISSNVITNTIDISGKQDITDNNLTTTNKTVTSAINEVNSIAKGSNQALSYGNYSAMVTAFNALDDDVYNVGQNIMIVTLEVPDLWISGIESTSSTYTYVDDATFVNSLVTNGYVQVGYYKVSMLETQKVDLTNYVTNTNYASNNIGGVIKTNTNYGTNVDSNGSLRGTTKTYAEYDSMHNLGLISKVILENVITGKSLVSNTDYASSGTGGVIRTGASYGTTMATAGTLRAVVKSYEEYSSAGNSMFIGKGTLENAITGKNIETANNKVTSISSSSTDTQYPSAKCVYDYIDNKVAIFNWDGQSSQDNSDNITLFQGIYDEQKERNCIVIVNSEPDEPCGCILNVPKNSMTYTTNNSAHEGYIIGNAYQNYQSVINGSYSMNITNFPCAGYIVEAEEITTVSQFFVGTEAIKFLDTSYNYPTPYTPTYNGSPATKKYVDDRTTRTTLWTNSSPTSDFSGQTITLSSSDYDYIMLYYARTPASRNEVFCNILEKNKDTELLYLDYFNGATRTWSRSAYIRNGTSVTFGACTINGSTTNTGLVPQKIIGCKY